MLLMLSLWLVTRQMEQSKFSCSNENVADLEKLGIFALFSFVITCLPVSRWGLK